MGYTEKFRVLMKSIDNNNRLNYFKNELLKILEKKEKAEETLSKSIQSYFDDINKTLYGISIEKGRAGTVGEIRTWKDGKKYKKMPNGKWVRVYQSHNRSAEISIARLKGKVRNAQTVDELMQIVMNNIHRFEDENGQILPIVEELKKEVAASKGKINTGKPSIQQQIEKFKADKAEKEKQLKQAEEKKTKKISSKKENKENQLSINDFPETFTKGGWKKDFQSMIDYINSFDNVNPKIIKMFKNLGKIKFNEPFSVNKIPKRATEVGRFVVSFYADSGIPAQTSLQLQKNIEESKKGYLLPIMIHEMTHLFDFFVKPNPQYHRGLSEMDEELLDAIDDSKMSNEDIESIKNEMKEKVKPFYDMNSELNNVYKEMGVLNKEYQKNRGNYQEYVAKFEELEKKGNIIKANADKLHGEYIGNEQFVDILDAITDGEFHGESIGGHGSFYYLQKGFKKENYDRYVTANKAKEIYANFVALSIFSPEHVERLRKMLPQLVEKLDILLDKTLYNLGVQ